MTDPQTRPAADPQRQGIRRIQRGIKEYGIALVAVISVVVFQFWGGNLYRTAAAQDQASQVALSSRLEKIQSRAKSGTLKIAHR
jgi:hypothetical protein